MTAGTLTVTNNQLANQRSKLFTLSELDTTAAQPMCWVLVQGSFYELSIPEILYRIICLHLDALASSI